jgi:hypothetical protein
MHGPMSIKFIQTLQMCTGLHAKYPLILSDFNSNQILTNFRNSFHLSRVWLHSQSKRFIRWDMTIITGWCKQASTPDTRFGLNQHTRIPVKDYSRRGVLSGILEEFYRSYGKAGCLHLQGISRDMRRLTTGIRSEKCVVRRLRRCANVYLHNPR